MVRRAYQRAVVAGLMSANALCLNGASTQFSPADAAKLGKERTGVNSQISDKY
jgi:hypothetical protein